MFGMDFRWASLRSDDNPSRACTLHYRSWHESQEFLCMTRIAVWSLLFWQQRIITLWTTEMWRRVVLLDICLLNYARFVAFAAVEIYVVLCWVMESYRKSRVSNRRQLAPPKCSNTRVHGVTSQYQYTGSRIGNPLLCVRKGQASSLNLYIVYVDSAFFVVLLSPSRSRFLFSAYFRIHYSLIISPSVTVYSELLRVSLIKP